MVNDFGNSAMAEKIRVFIAGCGDVGSRLAEGLLATGQFDIWGLRRNLSLLPAGVKAVAGDLAAEEENLGEWPEAIDYLAYCAAAGSRDESVYRAVYLQGLRHVLTKVASMKTLPKRIFFTSSTAVYHQSGGEWVDELSETSPAGFSGQVMLEAEALLQQAGIPGTSIRFGGIYGPGRDYLLRRVKSGQGYRETPVVYGNRIHADDCAGMLHYLIEKDRLGGNVDPLYVGVDDEPAPMHEVTDWLGKQLGITVKPGDDVPSRGCKRCSNARIKEAGYHFLYPSFREGYRSLLGLS
ncbi:SDR family oxidoreductase [Kistimonas scapharcae]|uniref:SDR family oxidoreductase n=2 Tax=Kistimonas scapharcae TaxID=1036133 RepID=A0ABP8V7G6_9GAMM